MLMMLMKVIKGEGLLHFVVEKRATETEENEQKSELRLEVICLLQIQRHCPHAALYSLKQELFDDE
jgi:hypothetical protein